MPSFPLPPLSSPLPCPSQCPPAWSRPLSSLYSNMSRSASRMWILLSRSPATLCKQHGKEDYSTPIQVVVPLCMQHTGSPNQDAGQSTLALHTKAGHRSRRSSLPHPSAPRIRDTSLIPLPLPLLPAAPACRGTRSPAEPCSRAASCRRAPAAAGAGCPVTGGMKEDGKDVGINRGHWFGLAVSQASKTPSRVKDAAQMKDHHVTV